MTEEIATTPSPQPSAFVRFLQSITGPWTWANLRGWVLLIGGVLFIKGCLVDQYAIPTGSMEPTLHGDPRFGYGDRVLVNKWLYGPRVPFTTHRIQEWNHPKRWDIVVFKPVPGSSPHPALIKRVIGLPGERVHISGGKIHIDGKEIAPPDDLKPLLNYTTGLSTTDAARKYNFLTLAKAGRTPDFLNLEHGPAQKLAADIDRVHPKVKDLNIEALSRAEIDALCEGVSRDGLNLIKNWLKFTQPPLVYGILDDDEHSLVPPGHYFCLGDNSDMSIDGRVYGWVPGENIYGQAFAVWWPWPRRRDFTGFSHTWWGAALIYGIPLALVGLELLQLRRGRDGISRKSA